MKVLNGSSVKQIFKGDQNIFWDGFLTDLSLAFLLAEEKNTVEFVPFIHDEKFGAPDQNLIHCLEKPIHSFFISEDYADSAGDATYLNLDLSYGIFYFPVVEEARLKEFSVSVKSLAKAFNKMYSSLDSGFINKSSEFGLILNFDNYKDYGFGEIPNREELNCFFDFHPEQRIFYLFTKALGRFGIAPVKDENILLSSLFLADSNLYESMKELWEKYLLNGLLNQASGSDKHEIQTRFDQLNIQFDTCFSDNKSIADFEISITKSILSNLRISTDLRLTKSSQILLYPEKYNINHFYLNSFMADTDHFTESYNTSLNETKMSIQRIKKGENYTNLPFYFNYQGEKNRTLRSEIFLNHHEKKLYYKRDNEYLLLQKTDHSFISGKAIPFLNEFRLENQLIALPEHGSKYTPACDAFIQSLRLKNIPIPPAKILRISLHFLDQLKIAGHKVLRLPKVLIPFFGESISCFSLSVRWREINQEIMEILTWMKENIKDGRDVYFASCVFSEPETTVNLTKFMHKEMLDSFRELYFEYLDIKKKRNSERKNKNYQKRYRILSFEIKLITRYYMQQLLQIHDGLLYLNDRPYSLAVYLMFGSQFVEELIKNVTFRMEAV